MSSPRKWIRPDVGGNNPVIRLKKVVLPAPLGPMTARRSPASRAKSTPSTGLRQPKFLLRPAVFRSSPSRLMGRNPSGHPEIPDHARDPLGHRQDHEDDKRPDDDLVVFEPGTHVVREGDDQPGPDDGAHQAPGAAQEGPNHGIAGAGPVQEAGVGVAERQGVERARQARERARDDEDQELEALDVVADQSRALLVLADADEDPPDRRQEETPAEEEGDGAER